MVWITCDLVWQVVRLIELMRDTGIGKTHRLVSNFGFKNQMLVWGRTDVAPKCIGYFPATTHILLIYGPDTNWKNFESTEGRSNNFLGPGCLTKDFVRDHEGIIVNPTQKPGWFGALFAWHHATPQYWVWDLTTGGSGSKYGVDYLCLISVLQPV